MNITLAAALCVSLAGVAAAQQTKPICIVDGVRYPDCDAVLGRKGVSSIAHVEVVKGPAAASAYGADAVNGAIIISTKLGAGNALAPTDDPLAGFLYPPELVMAHQQEIGLTDRQRSAIQAAMKEAQGKFVDLQFQMSGELEKLQRIVQPSTVDEAKMLDELDRVLAMEKEIKHAQVTLMIRIKNQLTEQQQAALGKLRP
jgi:TonB-dependent SusC/RagA subfamily outer membrane receptor